MKAVAVRELVKDYGNYQGREAYRNW